MEYFRHRLKVHELRQNIDSNLRELPYVDVLYGNVGADAYWSTNSHGDYVFLHLAFERYRERFTQRTDTVFVQLLFHPLSEFRHMPLRIDPFALDLVFKLNK